MPRPADPGWNPIAYHQQRARRRRGGFALAIIALAGLAGIDHAGLLLYAGDATERYKSTAFRVVRIIDGDTLEIDAPDAGEPVTRVRLWGIDTPETASAGDPAEPLAGDATRLARELVLHQEVRLELQQHRIRDMFGRLLAYVELPDGSSLNERLLVAGLAEADGRWPHAQLRRYAALERQARVDRVGLWAETDD